MRTLYTPNIFVVRTQYILLFACKGRRKITNKNYINIQWFELELIHVYEI